MVTLQNDLLEIYNNLTEFSKAIFESKNPVPIKVKFDRNAFESPLVFEAKGITVRLRLPIYYCLGLEDLEKETYLLPGDYDMMMESLQKAIYDPRTLDERTCIAPENYGFNIYAHDKNRFDIHLYNVLTGNTLVIDDATDGLCKQVGNTQLLDLGTSLCIGDRVGKDDFL